MIVCVPPKAHSVQRVVFCPSRVESTSIHLWPWTTKPETKGNSLTRSSASLVVSICSNGDGDGADISSSPAIPAVSVLFCRIVWPISDVKNETERACHTPICRFAISISLPDLLVSMLRTIGRSCRGIKSVWLADSLRNRAAYQVAQPSRPLLIVLILHQTREDTKVYHLSECLAGQKLRRRPCSGAYSEVQDILAASAASAHGPRVSKDGR